MTNNIQAISDYLTKLAPGGLCVAFSGGVDSALLLYLACQTGARVHAVTAYTSFHSALEPVHAGETAREYGAVHTVLSPEMPSGLTNNPPNRCYICKKALFSGVLDYANTHGLLTVLDGTNADDLLQYRPGLAALKELGVHSPLALCGITKKEVREMATELGLTIAKKPSAPCLLTRYPYNTRIDLACLPGIDKIERSLQNLGVGAVRARVEGDTLRIEVANEDFKTVINNREKLLDQALEAGFVGVTLDLEGFSSGSMDRRWQRLCARDNPDTKQALKA